MKTLQRTAIGLAIVAVALAGCSSSGGSDTVGATSAPAESEQVLNNYFNAFATDEASEMEPMLDNAEADSPAYLYAEHQINNALADEAANQSSSASTVAVSGDEVTMIDESLLPADATEEERAEVTTTYREFEYASDGKLVTWTAEPGGSLEGRVLAQDGIGTSGKVTIKAKTSYVTNAGDLIVTYDVRNKSKDQAMVTPKGYVNADKRQVQIATGTGSLDLAPGSFATEAASMENGEPGGKMTFTVYFTGTPTPPVTITVPVSDK